MKNKIFTYLVLSLCNYAFTQSNPLQAQVGSVMDINYQFLEGCADFDYQPKKRLLITFDIGNDFAYGHYYDLNHQKKEGLIKLAEYKEQLVFKETWEGKKETIKPEASLGYVLGRDSFTVISDFSLDIETYPLGIRSWEQKVFTKKQFAKVLGTVGAYTLYQHHYVGGSTVQVSYLAKSATEKEFISFPKKKEAFKPVALSIFKTSPYIVSLLEQEDCTDQLLKLLSIYNHEKRFAKGELQYYDLYWNTVDSSKNWQYSSEILSLKDSISQERYRNKEGLVVFEGQLSSFLPRKKYGDFTYYYASGAPRRKCTYRNNVLYGPIKVYYPNGQLHYEYSSEADPSFEQVLNPKGESLFDMNGNATEVFYDSLLKREITRTYVGKKLISSCYKDANGKLIYQFCQKNASLVSLSGFQTQIEASLRYPLNALRQYHQGYVLLKCIVEPNGRASSMEIIKGVDAECDKKVMAFFNQINFYKIWKPAKMLKEKVSQEIVVPICFSINSFTREESFYNHNYTPLHNHMMRQQMMQNYRPSFNFK